MRVIFDTSSLIPALVKAHPKHPAAHSCLKRAIKKEFEFLIAAHSLAECFAVLTTIPVSPRILPNTAIHLLEKNVRNHAKVISLSAANYFQIIKKLVALGLSGGIIYDGLVLAAGEKAKAEIILTYNDRGFQRLAPPEGITIVTPDHML